MSAGTTTSAVGRCKSDSRHGLDVARQAFAFGCQRKRLDSSSPISETLRDRLVAITGHVESSLASVHRLREREAPRDATCSSRLSTLRGRYCGRALTHPLRLESPTSHSPR